MKLFKWTDREREKGRDGRKEKDFLMVLCHMHSIHKNNRDFLFDIEMNRK